MGMSNHWKFVAGIADAELGGWHEDTRSKGFQEPWPDPAIEWPDGFDRPSGDARADAVRGANALELADRILAAVNAQPRTPT
jgi:hypothetical protein